MKRIDPGILKISDGTIEIDLLELCFVEWRPNVLTIKGSATQLDSPYSQGQQLVQAQFADVVDLFIFNPKDESADDLIEGGQDVRRFLEKARNYWLTKWQDEPVYLIARGQCETNTRYAQITNFLTPEDGNPYASPFNDDHIFEDWNLSITHRPWQEIEPGETVCVEAFAGKSTCIWSLEDDDSSPSNVSIPSNAAVDNLSNADWTMETWIYKQSSAVMGIAGKSSWYFRTSADDNLEIDIGFAVTNANATSVDNVIPIGEWCHIAMVFDFGTLTPRLYVNGAEVAYSAPQTAGNGALTADAGTALTVGEDGIIASVFLGYIGWFKLSSVELYFSEFTPPERCTLPYIDNQTIGLWIYEGTGATADNAEGTAAIDGTINNMTWNQGCVDNSDSYYGGGFDRCNFGLYFSRAGYCVIPADASIQDLPTNDFTLDGWVYLKDSFAGSNLENAYVFKSSTNFWFSNFQDLGTGYSKPRFRAGFNITNLESNSNTFIKHNQWVHIAFVYTVANKTCRIYINGVEIDYSVQTPGNGVYNTDVGQSLIFSSNNVSGLCGYFGWTRISDTERFTDNFVVPERCTLPDIDADTIGLWIYEGQGVFINNVPGASGGSSINGTITNGEWVSLEDGSECCEDFGTCEKENYFGLFSSLNQITHVFWEDVSAGTFSSNMIEDDYWPRELYPNPKQANDNLYFISDTSRLNTGPFSNIVLDIVTASAMQYATEYWNGAAWVAIPNVLDGAIFTNGVNGLFYEIPVAWAAVAVNGVTGYAIRIRDTLGLATGPIQQNRRPYTVNWPWVEFDEQAVPGDIAALAYSIIYGEGRDDGESEGIPSFQRLVMSLRSNSRGTAFNPYINISDVQQPCGLDVTKFGTGTWTTDIVNAPTGRYLSDTAVATGWQSMAAIVFDSNLALDYYGTFRAYLLAKTATGTIQYRLRLFESSNQVVIDPVSVIDTGVIEIVEFGEISIPLSDDIKNDEILSQFQIEIQANITTIGNVTEYYYLVLMPSDEYIIDTSNFELTTAIREDHPLDIDSIVYPKRIIRTWMKDESGTDSEFEISFQNDSVGAFFLQNNADQRLYFFGGLPGTDNWNQCLAVNAFQGFRNARYHSMRGSR